MITPNSRVYLLSTPLDNTQKNQIFFKTVKEQTQYFSSKITHSYENVLYQRKDNIIRVNTNIDYLWNSNYVMYQNTNFSNKWFYAFITKMEYVNERTTDIYIETDVFQTWLFDVEILESFVVREHVANDSIGANTIDEGLELGEYIIKSNFRTNKLGANINILAISDNSPLGNNATIGNIYSNIVTGFTYFPFRNNTSGINWLKQTIETYDEAGKSDALVMLFTVPELVVQGWSGVHGEPITSGHSYGIDTFKIDKIYDNLDGYIPKNNKLFTYPYYFLNIDNSVGGNAVFRYEDLKFTEITFLLAGALSPNPSVRLLPVSYKNDAGIDYSLTLKGYPMGSWNSDTYTAWLAQNSANIGVATIGSLGAIVGGAITGNIAAVAGGALGVFSQMMKVSQASIQPNQAKGQIDSGSLNYSTGDLDFWFSRVTIKYEYAKKIDDYFTMYGYKVNSLKIPETSSRRYWNYIQTIDINLRGNIPQSDMKKLKKIYNDGVTLWHDVNHYLDYSLRNYIV